MDLISTMPVNTAPVSTPQKPLDSGKTEPTVPAAVSMETPKDNVELSTSAKSKTAEAAPPKISRVRLMFSKLTDEQIKAVNESRMLPKNGKFQLDGKVICNNWFGICDGTQKLLPGYELKQNIFGFTVVVPEGTKGLFIKKSPEEKLAAQAAK